MNFYDEAIECKHRLQVDLVKKRRTLKDLLCLKSVREAANTSRLVLDYLYDYDINALEDADPYFWDARIAQMVLATGQQLPETVTFDVSWLKGKAGYWWFGRSSPLIGLSRESERKYVNALLWSLNPNGSLSIQTFYIDGLNQYSLGSLTWAEGESLADALCRLEEVKTELPKTSDLVIRDILAQLVENVADLTHDIVELAEKAIAKHAEVDDLAEQLAAEGVEVPKEKDRYSLAKLESDLSESKVREDKERRRVMEVKSENEQKLSEWATASKNALVTFACGSLWLKQKIITVAQAALTRAAERRLAKADIDPRCLVVELRSKQYTRTSPDDEQRHVDWAWQWAVRGHWRDQPTKEGYKLVWIHPFIKGPEDKPLKPSVARIFAVTR